MRRLANQRVLLAVWVGLSLTWSGLVRAENAVHFSNAAAEPGGTTTIDVIFENDLVIAAATVPFRWNSPDLTLESIEFVRDRYLGSLNGHIGTVSGTDRTASFTLFGSFNPSDPSGLINAGSGAVARLHFRVASGATDQWAFIDSIYETWGGVITRSVQFSNFNGTLVIFPKVYPGTITIGRPSGQASMAAVPDHLEFHGVRGGPSLPAQSVSLRSVNGAPFTWTAHGTATWLNVSPASGSSAGEFQVGVDLGDLDAGDYSDTVTVSSPEAANSPLRLPVTLRIEAETELGVTPSRLEFQSVVHGSNPSAQTLHLQATIDVPLAWSAQWGSSWLALTPSSGDQLGTISVGVDAVALDTGRYIDTIVLAAQGAANSPVTIPVVLVVDTAASAPLSAALYQNRPNPFSTYHDPSTSIAYTTAKTDHVDITLYDVLGRAVRHLVSGSVGAGSHLVIWDGRDDYGHLVASGHYFYRMKTSGSTVTRKMVVIK